MKVLITGAGARVGRAIALEFAKKGYDLALHYHQNQKGAQATLEDVNQLNPRSNSSISFCVSADLSTPQGCQSLMNEVEKRWGDLDVLINNASLFSPQPFESISDEMWHKMLHVNVTAPFMLSRDLLPLLKKGKLNRQPSHRRASIIHICDIGADRPLKGYTHYAVSKAALQMLVKSMAIELAPQIACVGVSPGQVAWPPFFDEVSKEKLTRRIPMQRSGEPLDIATLVRHLVLEAPYINGAIIPVDGGLACRY